MMKLINMVGLTAAVALVAAPAFAAQKLVVEKNHTLRVALNGTAGSVIVGNPEIADVTVIDSHTVYVVGKGLGNSGVTITDRMGRSLFDGEIVVTSSNTNGITVYKGLTPSTMVCSNVCVADPSTTANASGSTLTQISPVMSSGVPSAVSAAQGAASLANIMPTQ